VEETRTEDAHALPTWARRVVRLDAPGGPARVAALILIGVAFLAIAFIGTWNAQRYPVPLGYDAQGHVDYAHVLLHDHRLPTATEASEYRQPPGYYVMAGAAALLGEKVFGWHEDTGYATLPHKSYRGAQYLNVLFVLATAALLLLLARIVAPGRPEVWAAALLFFAFLPVVAKTEAMFHPDPLNMLLATAAVWLTTRILARGRLDVRRALALGALLVAGLLVRSSALFTLIAVGLSLAIAFVVPRIHRPERWTRVAGALAVVVVLGGGWIALYQGHALGSIPALTAAIHNPLATSTEVTTRSDFTHLSTAVFTVPFRPNYVNQALPVTYTEIWGDWIGAFSWSTYSGAPWPPALRVMKDQSLIGVLPTVLAIGGWLMLLAWSLRRRRELLAVVLLPPIALFGYFYRTYLFLSADGDLLKASYVLTTAPIWALGFGVAFGALGKFRLLRAGLGVCLLIFAVLELRFMLYGIRDHHLIF
jgi:hypothetical protein